MSQVRSGKEPTPEEVHVFTKGGRTFSFDPISIAAVELNADGAVVALSRRDNPPGPAVRPSSLVEGRPYDISVALSHACNLRCRYCFSDHDGRRESPLQMSPQVMAATARFIAQRNAGARLWDTPWVGGTGEAALILPLFERFSALLAEEGDRHGIHLTARLCTSNLTAAERFEAAGFLAEVTGVSLDGPRQAHDALRVYPDGRGTYDDVRRNLERLRAARDLPQGAATLTALYPDVADVYFHLFELGFGGGVVKPVRAEPHQPYAIGQNLDAVCAGYDRFVARLLSLPDDRLLRFLVWLTGDSPPDDYFTRFFVRVSEQHGTTHRCPAWVWQLTIDTDGRLYGCDSLVGLPEACVGSVQSGVDEARVSALFESLHVSRRSPCSTCWARFVCGGACPHQSYLTHGEFGPPDPAECQMNRHLIELAIWFHAELVRERPLVMAALPRSDRRGRRSPAPVECRLLALPARGSTCAAVLNQIDPSATLSPQHHLRGRLRRPSEHCSLEVRLTWDPQAFCILLSPGDSEPDVFWDAVRYVRFDLGLPRNLATTGAGELPSLLAFQEWVLVADPREAHLRCEMSPHHGYEGRVFMDAQIASNGPHRLVVIPWHELGLRSPRPHEEFGLGLAVVDLDGGRLEWFPDRQWGRIVLHG
jgi:uncharacterized protein